MKQLIEKFTKSMLYILIFYLFIVVLFHLIRIGNDRWLKTSISVVDRNSIKALVAMVASNEAYPETPEDFNRIIYQKIYFPLGATNDSDIYYFNCLKGYYYIGGISTNDPVNTPIVIRQNDFFPSRSWVLTISGDSYFFYEFNRNQRRELFNEPWKLVEDDFQTLNDYMAFTNRLQLFKVSNP